MGSFACWSATATPPMAWLCGPPYNYKVGHLHCAVKVQSTRPFYNCSHLQCRKHGIVDSLLEIVHNWVALLINSFLTTSVEDQARSDRKVINSIREGYRAPYTPQALVSGGSNNVGIVKGGGDHSSSHQAGYVRHVWRGRNRITPNQAFKKIFYLQAALRWLHRRSV